MGRHCTEIVTPDMKALLDYQYLKKKIILAQNLSCSTSNKNVCIFFLLTPIYDLV